MMNFFPFKMSQGAKTSQLSLNPAIFLNPGNLFSNTSAPGRRSSGWKGTCRPSPRWPTRAASPSWSVDSFTRSRSVDHGPFSLLPTGEQPQQPGIPNYFDFFSPSLFWIFFRLRFYALFCDSIIFFFSKTPAWLLFFGFVLRIFFVSSAAHHSFNPPAIHSVIPPAEMDIFRLNYVWSASERKLLRRPLIF